MSDLTQRLRAWAHDERLGHGPLLLDAAAEIERLRDIISPGDAAAYEEGMAALLARCEAAEARLAEAERLLQAWDGIDYEECEFGDFVAVAIDQHEFDTAREGLDDFLRPDNEAEAQEPPR